MAGPARVGRGGAGAPAGANAGALIVFLAGEWVSAWLFMSVTFFVAFAGVIGLGWWVLRGDARNRAAESPPEPEHSHSVTRPK